MSGESVRGQGICDRLAQIEPRDIFNRILLWRCDRLARAGQLMQANMGCGWLERQVGYSFEHFAGTDC